MVMLTATLSPMEESHLLIEYGVQWPRVIRDSSERQNLRYNTINVSVPAEYLCRISQSNRGIDKLAVCNAFTTYEALTLIVDKLEDLGTGGSTDCIVVYFNTTQSLEAFYEVIGWSIHDDRFLHYFSAHTDVAERDISRLRDFIRNSISIFGVYYHALDDRVAELNLQQYRENTTRVMLATSGFGKLTYNHSMFAKVNVFEYRLRS